MFASRKSRTNLKYFLVTGLGGLFIFAAFWFSEYQRLGRGVFIVALYQMFDLLWAETRNDDWHLSSQSLFSALLVATLSMPLPSYGLIVLLPLLAVMPKQFLCFDAGRRFFNPAAFALAIAALSLPHVSWWGLASASAGTVISALVIGNAAALTLFFYTSSKHSPNQTSAPATA